MAGKPGTQPDDDDLIVDLEDAPQDFAPGETEGIEAAKQETPEAPTLPDGIDDDGGEEPSRAPAARGKEEDGGEEPPAFDESYERIQEVETRARQAEANGIWREAQANARVVETQRDAAKVAIDTLNFRIDSAYGVLNQATEAGDSAARMQIERDIRNMEQLRVETQTGLAQMPTRDQVLADGEQKARQALASKSNGRKVGAGINATHPLAERWAGGNGWMKTNSRANAYVLAQSQKMAATGAWAPDSPSFYAELGRRVALAYPNLKIQDLQAQKRGAGKAVMRTPVAPTRSSVGGAVSRTNGKNRYVITAAEQATMKRHRLDPGNETHRKAWAKVRLERAGREAREGAR